MDINFANKVVLVTGASAGIGEATAILFAKYGAKLSLVGTNEANLCKVAATCEKEKGIKPLAITADLSTDEGCEKTARDTLNHFGRLDVLVNNAAIGAAATLQTADMATFDRIFNLNVRGVYNLTWLLTPALIESKGNIVNISSIAATLVAVGSLPYGMAKISNFVQRMIGISDNEYSEWVKNAEGMIPMGKACTGNDIARAIVYVASDLSALMTGALLAIDGAMQYGGTTGNLLKTLENN